MSGPTRGWIRRSPPRGRPEPCDETGDHGTLQPLLGGLRGSQYQSEFAKKYVAEGEARALLTALRVRGIEVPEAARERILAQGTRSNWSAGWNARSSQPRLQRCLTEPS
ncbi:MAG: hypothetical protein ABI134_28710 [Byssovorax sp.]